MQDLQKALADIGSIRQQLAAGTLFRGLGPAVVATTGLLAAVTATAQSLWLADLGNHPIQFLAAWAVTAILSAGLIGAEMIARTRRHHAGLADAMLMNAVGQSLPAGVAGAAIALVLIQFAPDTLWVLPGLMANLCGAWHFRLRPLAAAHRGPGRGLVCRRRPHRARPVLPDADALAVGHGPAVRGGPAAARRHPPSRLRSRR